MLSGQKAGGIWEEVKPPETLEPLDRMHFTTSVTWVFPEEDQEQPQACPTVTIDKAAPCRDSCHLPCYCDRVQAQNPGL